MKRENKFRKVYVKAMERENKLREFHLKGMQRENKFREFRYFSSLQPRKFLPRKFLPLTLFWVGYFDLVFGWGGGKITPPG